MSHEFKVVLDGIDLSSEDVKVINRAVQNAVMGALHLVSIPEKVCIHRPVCGSGGICGIVIRHPGDELPSPLDPPTAG